MRIGRFLLTAVITASAFTAMAAPQADKDKMDHRQKKMGYNAAKELYNRVQASLTRKRNPEEE